MAEESKGIERRASGRAFHKTGPTTEKALCCMVVVRENGTKQSPRVDDLSERRPREAEVKTKSSDR